MVVVAQSFAAIWLLSLVTCCCTAVLVKLCDVAIKEIRFGFGPRIASVRKTSLCLIPLGCSVKVVSVSDEDFSPLNNEGRPYESLPVWQRIAFHLATTAILLEVAFLGAGKDGFDEFCLAFAEIPLGAWGPLSRAQAYLTSYAAFVRSNDFLAVVVLLSAKLAAVNALALLPRTTQHLSQRLSRLFGKPLHPDRHRSTSSAALVVIVLFGVYGSWVVALAAAAW